MKFFGGISITISGGLFEFENDVYQIIFPIKTTYVEMILYTKFHFSAVNWNRFNISESDSAKFPILPIRKFSYASYPNWRKDGQLFVAPVPNERSYGMYMNRASEIGWLVTRLLPLLQTEPRSFGEEWVEKLYVLDDSFRHMVEGLRDLGKEIGAAFIEFVDTKFPFSPDNHYVE